MRTYSAKPGEIDRNWYVVDASEYELGRLATRVAIILRGKHKPVFTPHVDAGDFVVIVNASQIRLSGNKAGQKKYQHYSGYPGGLKTRTANDVRQDDPDRMLREAVWGMLPKNRLSKQLLTKLKVYGGAEHPHTAQKPQPFPNVF